MAKTNVKYPTLKISIVDQKPSGYFREDTLGSPNPIQKTVADAYYIPNTGEGIKFVKQEKGEDVEISVDEYGKLVESGKGHLAVIEPYPIRYIKGCPSIDQLWQESHNWKPRPDPKADEICIEGGYAEFEYSHDPAKYIYLKSLLWNKSLPYRMEHKKALFYEVVEAKKVAINVAVELLVKEATDEWSTLLTKDNKGGFTIDEAKVRGYAGLLNATGETAMEMVQSLLAIAKTDPVKFVDKVKMYKEEAITDVSHAMQLGLVSFEGNNATFFNGKIIPLGKVTAVSSKIEKTAEGLKMPENKEFYVQLKAQIELKKEEALN